MIGRSVLTAVIALTLLDARPALAQEDGELIFDRPSNVTVKTRPKAGATPTPGAGSAVAPTPRPEDVIIGIVNNRVLTKAELNARVTSQFERIRADVQSRIGGVVGSIQDDPAGLVLDLSDKAEVLEEQKLAIEQAMRREEEAALRDWTEHSLLAEEARRQGVVIAEDEFKRRLSDAERVNELEAGEVEGILANMRFSRADYEKSVYDALMIEQLLHTFIDLNYTEEQYRKAFDANPAVFYKPPTWEIAHFTVALLGTEDAKDVAALKNKAEKVRDLLRAGKDPKEIFEMPEYEDPKNGVQGLLPGSYSFTEAMLPPIVENRGLKMKVGDTSDVLLNREMIDGKVVTRSMHVIKLLKANPEVGATFESAMPAIRRSMNVIAREALLAQLYKARTHRVITNLGGIKAEKIPTREEMDRLVQNAQPISLKLPQS